jgi:hypothetical protein
MPGHHLPSAFRKEAQVFGSYKRRRSPPAKETSGYILSPYFRSIAAAGPIIWLSAVNRRVGDFSGQLQRPHSARTPRV